MEGGARPELPLFQMSPSADVAQQIVAFLVQNDRVPSRLRMSRVYSKFYKPHKSTPTRGPGISSSRGGPVEASGEAGPADEPSDLKTLKMLLKIEGLRFSDPTEEKNAGRSLDLDVGIKRSLESCCVLMREARHAALERELKSLDVDWARGASPSDSALREKTVKLLVELLTSQVKEKLLVVRCLQMTYLVMSRYDWRVVFGTEGGVRAVLASMREHDSSSAIQHMGLAVLKVLTGAGRCHLWDISQNYFLNPENAQAIKEVFDIKSIVDGTSTSLLAAIPGAVIKMMCAEGCFSSVYNGLLVIRILAHNHQDLWQQWCDLELPAVLQTFLRSSQDLLSEPQQHLLSFLLPNMLSRLNAGAESSPFLVLEERDLMMLLNALKDSQKFRKILPSLKRCIYKDFSSLCCDVPQLLTDRSFYNQLLCSLELLRSEKCLRLCIYRMLNKALLLYEEDSLPWHQSIAVSLGILEASSGVSELLQEVILFLHSLSSLSEDHAVLMCCLQSGELLEKVPEQQTSERRTSDLKDRLASCEKFTDLHNKMSAGVMAGCMQIVLCQIDEERLRPQGTTLPLLDVFLQGLAGACSGAEQKQVKCWEKLETSSNPQQANRLTDGNPKSYWQSSSSTRCHYINMHMRGGMVIRKLVLVVASEDGGYMPARVVVKGGEKPFKVNTLLSEVNIGSTAGRVVLLENVARFWPVIQILILRCQQGGTDTRVRGLEILGRKPTLWTVFKEQLCRRTFLFYTSKAHTWGQEIHRKKENLLHLFRRLNQALSHEQEFAERFLPDDEAAQALGRTCWEALICPLVQSITTSDSGAESPLGWLLTRYLENSQISRRPQSRPSVFNSRVRRLTHLLVHVDTTPPDTTVLKPPTKTNGKRRDSSIAPVTVFSAGMSSMAGMAQCWQGVVQQQVQRFLEKSWNDADLVPRFCAVYLTLRRAMEEMFGQQTLFLLALRQGFCEGLLQLSFLTALHVTEQFARYIDQRVTAVRLDASDVQSLEQLQQFLEFVLFLSDLELANSFEHFYRHYLADRLLTLGPCWLENSVVNHIGVCFPNRFPQQMLKNLQEAKDLQREQHLYRLQELDTGLLSEEEGEVMEIEESAEPQDRDAEEAEVQISVLSPRCWSVSSLCYMMDPSRHFPEFLSSPLQHFADFYLKSQSALGSQLKQLQWTWLGNAEVQYGDLTLRVSTLQMFILLHFNQQEELLEETIIHSSGLPEALVHHALAPLITKGGILVQKKGLLCLNEEGLIDPGTGKVLQLLPRQTYLNVEEDEGRTLEKKRNIILCLITQIMKEEKEIHIDNLVFRVIESCWKLEVGKKPKFLNFSCNDTDVLSCIMYLIGQGYARRGEDSPHIIQYLSKDPSTPHRGKAHISFQSSTAKNQESTNKWPSSGGAVEQAVLESVLLPMGRTLRQEEVGKLMSHMVDQVSETLSVSKDQAEHLLIYCKWNMDLLLQKYTDDPEILLVASGLQVQEAQASESPQATCPVCMGPLSPADNPPSLCCRHSCCENCWKEYLTTRIEQNLVLNCTCPTTDCVAQPTSEFIRKIISSKEVIEKYDKALLRGFVESCSNLTWCTNPQGCDRILCKEGLGTGAACAKCSWLSCFNCSFPEAHYPASCSHMSQWMDDGGFYEGMTAEAQSKHLTKLISKHCPSCQAPIEKNEGCLHMTCAKCNHGFCWRCLKPWKPTHKDYYNCTAMVSKAARQEKRFQDYNERCTFQHQAKDFAISLRSRLSVLNEEVPLRTLSFLITACKVLEMSRKVLGYACVYSYYNQDSERLDVLESQTENLEFQVNALQLLLEYGLLQSEDLACSVRLLSSDQYNSSLELVRRVQERLNGILQHSTQDFRVGFLPAPDDTPANATNLSKTVASSRAADTVDGGSDTGDTADEQEDDDDDDDEYVPEWNVDYDDDLDEDDFSYDEDDESENLEPDSFIFEDYDGEAY